MFVCLMRLSVNIPFGDSLVLRLARTDSNDSSCQFTVSICFPAMSSGDTTRDREVTWPMYTLNQFDRSSFPFGEDTADSVRSFVFPIDWDTSVMELTVAQYWGVEAPATVVGEVCFRGLEPNQRTFSLVRDSSYRPLPVVVVGCITDHISVIFVNYKTSGALSCLSAFVSTVCRIPVTITCVCRFDRTWRRKTCYHTSCSLTGPCH